MTLFNNLHYEKFANGTVKCIEDEIPYELPEGWMWCRLSMIGTTNIGLTYKPSDIADTGVIVLRSCNIKNGKIDLTDLVRVQTDIRDNQYIENNDIIICARNGSRSLVGKCAILKDVEEKISFGAFMANFRSVCYRYVYRYFNTPLFRSTFDNDDSKQINQVTQAILRDTLIPLPPFAEQERIADKLDTVFALIDSVNDETENIETLIKITKAHILDLAIRGQLVPQDPNDEPASVLLERIHAEKEELIRQGKIKRDKKDSVIFKGEDNSYYEKIGEKIASIDDELPFEIPNTWIWTRFKNIVANYDNYRRPITKHNRINTFGLYDYYGATGAIDKVDSYIFDGDYLMIGEDGGNFFTQRDNSFIVSGKFWANNHVHVVQPLICDIWYLKHFLDSCDLELLGLITGIGVPKLNQENMNNILVPIPPIEEQVRIACDIKKIYSVIADIEKGLT